MFSDQLESAVLLFERQLCRDRLTIANSLHRQAIRSGGNEGWGHRRLSTGNEDRTSHEDRYLANDAIEEVLFIVHLALRRLGWFDCEASIDGDFLFATK